MRLIPNRSATLDFDRPSRPKQPMNLSPIMHLIHPFLPRTDQTAPGSPKTTEPPRNSRPARSAHYSPDVDSTRPLGRVKTHPRTFFVVVSLPTGTPSQRAVPFSETERAHYGNVRSQGELHVTLAHGASPQGTRVRGLAVPVWARPARSGLHRGCLRFGPCNLRNRGPLATG